MPELSLNLVLNIIICVFLNCGPSVTDLWFMKAEIQNIPLVLDQFIFGCAIFGVNNAF